MDKEISVSSLLQLRFSVAYLGENRQADWWSSVFFSTVSQEYLSPVFPRTTLLSKYHGAQQAASFKHDEYIGVGIQVFHLFRLPETMEQSIYEYLRSINNLESIGEYIGSPEKALQSVLELAGEYSEIQLENGPVRVGETDNLYKRTIWQKVAQYYHKAFLEGVKTYPYIVLE